MRDPQEAVQQMLDDLVERDVERGVQVAAYIDGELVVDAWSGVADPTTGRKVDSNTLFTGWSCTKGVAATAIHLLAERDQLDYDWPVARWWPEFAANGKATITLRHVLTHTAGIPQFPQGIGPEQLLDWETMCNAVAGLRPLWEPGTAMGYHANTYGWLVGEIARRVDGRMIAEIIRDDICVPLAIDGLFLGIPDEVEQHVAHLEEQPVSEDTQPSALGVHVVPPWRRSAAEWANQAAVRRACLPSSGGIMNARSLARHYAALMGDKLNGIQLLPQKRMSRATTLQFEGDDCVLGGAARRAMGYHLGEPLSAMGDRVSVFGHAGAGGSIGFADPDYRFAFALTKNRMVNGEPAEAAAYLVANHLREALGIPN